MSLVVISEVLSEACKFVEVHQQDALRETLSIEYSGWKVRAGLGNIEGSNHGSSETPSLTAKWPEAQRIRNFPPIKVPLALTPDDHSREFPAIPD